MEILHTHFNGKKHVIWDWNGTLLCDLELALESTNRILREEKLAELSADRYREIFRFPVIEYYQDLGLETSPGKFAEICDRFNAHFHGNVNTCELWPGALETLAYVKASGRTQSLLSASEQNLLDQTIDDFGLRKYFDNVYGIRDKAAASKVYRGKELMAASGIDPKHTVLIGDTDHDLEVGKALNVDVILVEHGHQHPDRLRAVHHNVVKIF